MRTFTNRKSRGFTLLELMISMAVFLILSGAVLGGMSKLQGNYRMGEVRTTMQQRLRATMELMAQEIGQAGLQASTVEGDGIVTTAGAPYTINSAITATGSQTVNISTSSGLYVGQWLQVDGGANQDPIQIIAFTATNGSTSATITATFGLVHTTGRPAYPMGVFPDGIVYAQSTATKLAMYGDINGSGNGLYAVKYTCPTVFPGSLTRTEWSLPTLTATSYPLIDNVTACSFTYTTSTAPACPASTVALPPLNVSINMVTQVGFTITATETPTLVDTGATLPISITKSYSNIQPRNIIAANNIYIAACNTATAKDGTNSTFTKYLNGELQPDPTVIASVPW